MNNCKIDYYNYDERLYPEFPRIAYCKVSKVDDIIHVHLECDKLINDLEDDIGYDNSGKFLSLTIGQWHHMQTGKYIANEDFCDLTEMEAYQYEYISGVIKIPVDKDYRACYHNYLDKRVRISFIPYDMLTKNVGKTIFEYRIQ